MPVSESTNGPTLQAPGAGLPWWELLAARYVVFPRACRKLGWNGAGVLFQNEGATILSIWDRLSLEQLTQRVLIRRIRAIEDSSRNWSVAMTVEHLNIVGGLVRQVIAELRAGRVLARVARIQDVKPRGEMPAAEVREQFVRLLADAAASDVSEPPIARGEGPRFAHPWFGPIDAYQWHCLLAVHQRIHRKQIDAIVASLFV